MADINKEWMEWCEQHSAFPEDFIAEAMKDDEDKTDEKAEELQYKLRAIKTARRYISCDEFMEAVAEVMVDFKKYADFFGVEFDDAKYAEFAACVTEKLFADTINTEVWWLKRKDEKKEEEQE